MKTTSMTMLSIFLVLALACVIAQEFAIHLLYDRCETLSSEYNQLAMRKTQILYMPYTESNIPPALYTPIDPQIDAMTLAVKNKNPLNIKKPGDGEAWEGQIGVDEQGHAVFSSWEYGVRAGAFTLRAYAQIYKVDTIDKLVSRFSEVKGKQFEVYVLFLCNSLSIDRDEKINLIHRMPDLLRALSRYESGMDLPNELFVSYDVLEKIE